ncbi:hypothetical protein H8E65_01635 [Candidatus Bathyarchaeota archaeon]|nr:hypothetical protein [Candidatus Bathyarchaeota archaeon]
MGGTPYEWEIDLEEAERPARIDGKCPMCENPISLAVLESGYAVVIDYNLAENIEKYIQCLQCLRILKPTFNEGSVEFEVVEETVIRTGGNCPVCENFISLSVFHTGDTKILEGALNYKKHYVQCDECFTVLKHSVTKDFYEHAKAQEDALLSIEELNKL